MTQITNSSNLGLFRKSINTLENNLNTTNTNLNTANTNLTSLTSRIETVETEVQPISRGGTGNTDGTAVKTKFHGDHTEAASNGDAGAPSTGMLYSSGLYITGTYNDSNTPATYGNIINIAGRGTGQLLCEWKGTDTLTGSLYYRSHRDTNTGAWGGWVRIPAIKSSLKSSTSWYIEYDNGFIMQGGTITQTASNLADKTYSITLPKAMSTTYYYADAIFIYTGSTSNWGAGGPGVVTKTTTTVSFMSDGINTSHPITGFNYYICGY